MELFYKDIEKKDWAKSGCKQIKNLNKETYKNLIKNLMSKCITLT